MVADLFHYGHVEFLKQARQYGDYLVVGLSTDANVTKRKRKPVLSESERRKVLEACRYVDEVRIQDKPLTNEWLRENGFVAMVSALGTAKDRQRFKQRLDRFEPQFSIEVPYENGISTTEIIRRIKARDDL
jgi:cytidyltransferase-like protein